MIFPVPVEETYPGGRYTLRGQYPAETVHQFYLAVKSAGEDFSFFEDTAFGPICQCGLR